jgi:hypothetical protein
VLGVNEDDRLVVVELKKDNNLEKAVAELEDYTNWLLGRGTDFHPTRGNPAKTVEERYLPNVPEEFWKLSPSRIEAVAVVVSPGQSVAISRRAVRFETSVLSAASAFLLSIPAGTRTPPTWLILPPVFIHAPSCPSTQRPPRSLQLSCRTSGLSRMVKRLKSRH